MTHTHEQLAADHAALHYYHDQGIDEVLRDEPLNRFAPPPAKPSSPQTNPPPGAPLRKSEACARAIQCAKEAQTLEDLQQAITDFDGLALKKTATNLVFSDGNPQASIMLIGEAPGADEDRQGKPFAGHEGTFLDLILSSINLERTNNAPDKAVYMTTLVNWRPPGNRALTPTEIEISLPFLERHIQLIKPKILILCGAITAKTLLGSGEPLSRLRKSWHEYKPQTQELQQSDQAPIPAIATYPPAYLLKNPAQKRATWADMLNIQAKARTFS